MYRIVSAIIASPLLVLSLLGSPASAATKIKLLYVPASVYAASWVAQDLGLFEKHGLDVDLTFAANGATIAAALVGNSAQIGAVTPPQLLQGDEQGLDLVIVAGTFVYPAPPGGLGMVVREGSGIKNASDLIGKKVGVPSFGGTNDVFAKKWVELHGADYHKINWVEIPFPQMSDALKSGLLDAVVTNVPFYPHIIASKVGYDIGDWSSAAPAGTLVNTYASTRSWAAENSQIIGAFRAALDEAASYINDQTHTALVYASISKYAKLALESVAAQPIASNFDSHVAPQNIKFWIDVAHEQGLINGNPDPANLIAP